MPALVRGGERIAARQESSHNMREVVARHLGRAVVLGGESQQTASEDTPDQRPEHDVKGAGVEFRRAPGREQDACDGDAAAWDLQEGCFVAREAEAFDQDRLEASHGSVGDRGRDGYEGEEPGLGVCQALLDLVGFEVFVLDSCLVFAQSFDGGDFFGVR